MYGIMAAVCSQKAVFLTHRSMFLQTLLSTQQMGIRHFLIKKLIQYQKILTNLLLSQDGLVRFVQKTVTFMDAINVLLFIFIISVFHLFTLCMIILTNVSSVMKKRPAIFIVLISEITVVLKYLAHSHLQTPKLMEP